MIELLPLAVRPGRAARAPNRTVRAGDPVIWAVASGKGGVGKSVLSASLAIGLAQTGPRAVAVDLDLGGANLHTLFGCQRARHTLSDFVHGRIDSLGDALAGTTVPGVRLLSGARAALDLANATFAQKRRILAGLAKIDAGHVVLDLGAGSSFHTLDAFLAADRKILVVTPEPTAIENAYHFLKAAFFRALRGAAQAPEVRDALASVVDDARRSGATPRELVEAASRVDARAGAQLRARLRELEVDLVVNRSDTPAAGEPIAAAGRAHLGVSLRLAGSLATDSSVPAAVARGVPVMQLFPATRFCADVQALVAALFADEPASATRALALTASLLTRSSDERRASPMAPEPASRHRFTAPGRYLRERREQLGLDLAALHERSRIRHRYLEAIEAERFDALPPEVIVREYVRQIAHALTLAEPEEHARRFVEKARASRAAIALAGAVSRPNRAPARPEVPSAEQLLAEFDDDPELAELSSAPAGSRTGVVSRR
jgi:flagellar biosynthesis protein FlhG